MNESLPLYNSRITKTYLQYLEQSYPDVDINRVLRYARMTLHEVADPAHWFSQEQADRFQEALVKQTGNPNIAREAGRFTMSYEGFGPAKEYTIGLVSLASVFVLMGRFYPLMSRGATIRAKKLRSNKVEMISTPNPGVIEKSYQCENRLGVFESLANLFTGSYPDVEHPSCFHKGDASCRYIITWKKTAALKWKRLRNYFMFSGALSSAGLFFFLPLPTWTPLTLLFLFILAVFSYLSVHFEKTELAHTIKMQGDSAKDLLDEMNTRYNHTLLVQEIGQATSKILNIEKLIETVVSIIKKRLNFDRGLIMLANDEKTRLLYQAGYGYTEEQKELLQKAEFHLDKPSSKGVFVVSYRDKMPILVDDISKSSDSLSNRSLEMAQKMGVRSFICVPIVYEDESIGILAVDNIETKKPHTQSDVNLLMGVASQTAVSIMNAMSFEKLQESEKKYRDLVENANSIIMRRDIQGKITFFNEFAQKFFGYSEKEILGKNLFGTILPNTGYARRRIERLVRALQSDPERQITSENENLLRNGDKAWIAWTYKPIFDSNGKLIEILGIGNDITELKRSEQEKRDLETRLQRAQKMEAIGTLAGGVAHDLNNILSGLVSYPELLLLDIPPESPLRKPILTIQKSGERAASIVQDLLTLARRGVTVTEVVDLNDMISEYINSPEHEKLQLNNSHIKVRTDLEPKLLNIIGSPVHLSKTLMNMVFNAAEAMPDGGEILIKTRNRYVDKPMRGFDEINEGDYVTLTISDNGIGIPKSDIERVFEPFYSKKVMGKSGTGLGMAVIWGTVKDHNGYIDLKSDEGRGTTITLFFPVTKKARVDLTSLPEEEFVGNGESILVVDDVEEQRDITSEMLAKLGYSVTTASSGEEAVKYVTSNPADLLVLDMIMDPGIDGFETYKRILDINPKQKAIITSGFSESGLVRKALKIGAGAYVKKPYLLEEIGVAVKAELNK